jgi:hypothetical protein
MDAQVLEKVLEKLLEPFKAARGDLADHLSAVLSVQRIDAFYSLEHLHELEMFISISVRRVASELDREPQLLLRAVHD